MPKNSVNRARLAAGSKCLARRKQSQDISAASDRHPPVLDRRERFGQKPLVVDILQRRFFATCTVRRSTPASIALEGKDLLDKVM